ncbi:MAG: DUF3772 domain-containing protein [Pseudomonadota bacterium]
MVLKRLNFLWFPLFLLLTSASASAQGEPANGTGTNGFAEYVEALDGRLENGAVLDEDIESERTRLEEYRQSLTTAADQAQDARAPLAAELEALGPAPEDGNEPVEIAAERSRLSGEIEAFDIEIKRAQQDATRARTLMDKLLELRRDRFTQRLLSREVTPLDPQRIYGAIRAILSKASEFYAGARTAFVVGAERGSFVDRFALPVLLSIIALIIAVILRRKLVAVLLDQVQPDASRYRRFAFGAAITLARLLMPMVALAILVTALSNTWFAGGDGQKIIQGLLGASFVLIGAYALGRAFYAPGASHLRLSALDNAPAAAAHRALMMLAGVVALHRLITVTGEQISLGIDALVVLNAAFLIAGGLALWHFTRAAGIGITPQDAHGDADADAIPGETPPTQSFEQLSRAIRLLAFAVAIAAPLLALAGYYRASQYIFYPLTQSGALIGVCLLIYRVVREMAAGAAPKETDDDPTQQQARTGLIPVLTAFLLSVVATPLLALIWGADRADLIEAWGRVVDGFQVGEVIISPIDFLAFAIVFAVGYIFTRMIQGILRRSVLPLTRWDEGAKSASLAGVGYVGVVVAALVAISTTGLDLSNIAIVAGALSVGIGFGLQNVVNNFVSGIILLIERPIKTGDWVEIGGTHGTVRKVNVRSTEIQTFDRSTMFVPNADLISGTVTNWTHGNSLGRIIVGVGVAYGSDARFVERILLEIAQGHPMLMKRPAPYIVFSGFGADSLDFEIRGVLRDVNWILNVGSDIRFSIYERFAQEGIEIPFGQRDIHIRSIGELRDVLGPAAPQDRTQTTPQAPRSVPPGEGPDADGGDGDGR